MSKPEPSKDNEPVGARVSRFFELLVGSSLAAFVAYSILWAAFQSLLIGHFTSNEGRFVALSTAADTSPVLAKPDPAPVKAPKVPGADATNDEDTVTTNERGDAIEIWYASAKHRSILHPCHLDFEYTGMNLTNYKFGSDRRKDPRIAKYLPVSGFVKNPKLPGPFVFAQFQSTFGFSRTYQMPFDFKKDANGNYIGIPDDRQTFEATSALDLNIWECTTIVFVGGTFKVVDFTDFTFIKQKLAETPAPQ